jgi:hypothetical protein
VLASVLELSMPGVVLCSITEVESGVTVARSYVLSNVGDDVVVYGDIILSSSVLVREAEVKEAVVALVATDSLLSIDCDVAVMEFIVDSVIPLNSVVVSNGVALVLDSVFLVL